MGCGSFFKFITKFILCLLNFTFTIGGLAISIAAIVFYVKLKDVFVGDKDELIASSFQWVAIVVISLGFLIFVIAFCGFVGAISDNQCLLITYAVFMLAIIGGKTYVAVKYKDVGIIQSPVQKLLTNSFDKSTDPTFNIFEATLHCCGLNGPDSYLTTLDFVPATCCSNATKSLNAFIKFINNYASLKSGGNVKNLFCEKKNAFVSGCLKDAHDVIEKYGEMILKYMIAIIAVEALEFFGAIFLCIMKSQKDKYSKRGSYRH